MMHSRLTTVSVTQNNSSGFSLAHNKASIIQQDQTRDEAVQIKHRAKMTDEITGGGQHQPSWVELHS